MEILPNKKIILLAALFLFFACNPHFANAADTVVTFNVDKDFDATARTEVRAILVKTTPRLYFYIEKQWWDSQPQQKQEEVLAYLDNLSLEFSNKIYPKLTSIFGSEWRPGVDGDSRITVLFEAMNSSEGGYFREADEYIKLQTPVSNEKEMIYLALDKFADTNLKVVLAHEFMHLITFNQKNKNFGVEEEVWLNEARADYSSTVLEYDNNYEGSNLQSRVKDFVQNPSDSVTEWIGTKYDYASAAMFMHYLVDQYSINILIDSLKSKKIGIDSINYALERNGAKEDFGQIFSNWTIASIINNCSVNTRHCYFNENLKNFRVKPDINFLPVTGNVSLSVTNVTKNWSGNWLKFIGGNGDLKLNFSSLRGLDFKVPYIIEDSAGSSAVNFLMLDKDQGGEIDIENFGTDYKSLIIIPSLQSKTLDFDGQDPTYPFSYSIQVAGSDQIEDKDLIQKLLDQIVYLKAQIAALLAKKDGQSNQGLCAELSKDLHFGMMNNSDVSCLQSFLNLQGPDIYPEGLVTGNFAALTQRAVIKFQEKYAAEILSPLGLSRGTGYVGPSTRNKINQILNGA